MRPPPAYVERFLNICRQRFPSTAPPEDETGPSGHEETRFVRLSRGLSEKGSTNIPCAHRGLNNVLKLEADNSASPMKAKAGGAMRGLFA